MEVSAGEISRDATGDSSEPACKVKRRDAAGDVFIQLCMAHGREDATNLRSRRDSKGLHIVTVDPWGGIELFGRSAAEVVPGERGVVSSPAGRRVRSCGRGQEQWCAGIGEQGFEHVQGACGDLPQHRERFEDPGHAVCFFIGHFEPSADCVNFPQTLAGFGM